MVRKRCLAASQRRSIAAIGQMRCDALPWLIGWGSGHRHPGGGIFLRRVQRRPSWQSSPTYIRCCSRARGPWESDRLPRRRPLWPHACLYARRPLARYADRCRLRRRSSSRARRRRGHHTLRAARPEPVELPAAAVLGAVVRLQHEQSPWPLLAGRLGETGPSQPGLQCALLTTASAVLLRPPLCAAADSPALAAAAWTLCV